ncbi:MAG: WYL domain-containing protein, partial [Clostridiales bacterium]|nr:WYL domain-containing protein [Clostridiales bacterium]
MENNTKARLLYVLQLLEQYSDEEHPLTTADLLSMLMEKYGISTHRITLKTDIETLQAYGVDIEVINSSQNKYYISSRQFEIPELKLLIDAVESSKFITAAKSKELVEKLCTLTSESKRATLVRNVSCEGRIKPGNEKIYYIVDCIN